MSIFLRAIFIFCGLILLLVAEISEQPRYIFANISGLGQYFSKLIFVLKHWVQACRFEYHEPYNGNNYYYYKISVFFRGFCYKKQNQTTKNETGAQKNVHIFKSNTPTLNGLTNLWTNKVSHIARYPQ